MSDSLYKDLDLLSQESLRKKKLLARVCFVFAAIISIYLSTISVILPGLSIAKILGMVAIVILTGAGIASQYDVSYRASAWTVVCVTLLVGTGASIPNGGMEGYLAPLLITAPVAAALFLGPKSALASAVAVVCAYAGLLYLDTIGLIETPPYAHEDIRLAAFILLSTTVLVCAAAMTVFADHSDTLITQLLHSQKQLQASEQVAKQQRSFAEEKRDEAEHAIQTKDRFLSNVSHEIRTPLNGIVGLVDVLESTKLSPAQTEMLHLVKVSGQSLQRIIEDILSVSKLDHGNFELQETQINVGQEVLSAAAPFRTLAEEKGLDFEVTTSDTENKLVNGDPVRIRQIVSNLVSNAVKFTDKGRVSIDLSVASGRLKNDYTITVEDTGIGFAPDAQNKIFERFEQAPLDTKNLSNGTGLGLSIVKELTERMGGEISATSTPGRGSRFVVTLELARAASAPIDEDQPAMRKNTTLAMHQTYRVLCAEDHPVNKKVISLILDSEQFDVTHVDDGVEAIAAFRQGDFDLILMDMQMPNMNGIDATKEIRAAEAKENRRSTTIIMLSANAFNAHVEDAMEAGCDGHIPKPFTPETLITGISDALERKNASPQYAQPA